MALEDLTGTKYIDSLVATNPTASDNKSEGDDHLRGIKNVLKTTFPNVSGAITATHTELSYCDGVTSAIQTQLDAKQATITGGATSITSSNLTASRALVSDGSGKVGVSATTSTELGYVNGVTSAIQTQLNAKVDDSQLVAAGSATAGAVAYNGSIKASGKFYSGTTDPTNTTRLNYDGYLYVTRTVGDWSGGSSGVITPFSDNTFSLGESGSRWTSVWAANGTIQTSDEREKTEIQDSRLGLNFVNSLRPVSYKWINGGIEEGKRTHYGLIAQEVKASYEFAGVEDFGGWVLTDKNDKNSQQALRYDQFIAPLIKAVQELSSQVDELKKAVK